MTYKIGDHVSVDGEELDDVGRDLYAHLDGKHGRVYLVDYNHDCGANSDGIDGSNTDPFYHVGFDDGTTGQFFEEELSPG